MGIMTAASALPPLSEQIGTDGELRAAIAIDIDGQSVVDVSGGDGDRAKTVERGRGTLSSITS